MTSKSTQDTTAASSPQLRWTAREAELLAVTLNLLQRHGYARLTVQAVATAARTSKATLYRRWPSKDELVLAAFIEGTRYSKVPPRTGSLRGDLLDIGTSVCRQAREHASTMRAVLSELARNPTLSAALQDEFVLQRKQAMDEVISSAVERGEIDSEAVNDETYDLLPGYLVFRSLVSANPPTDHTVHALVDEILIPSLTRNRKPASPRSGLRRKSLPQKGNVALPRS